MNDRGVYPVIFFIAALFVIITSCTKEVWPHDWFPTSCCNGGDCRVITADRVLTTKNGFVFPGNPEVVPYSSPKIRQTPPDGDGAYAICTKGGEPDTEIICLYIPNWGV